MRVTRPFIIYSVNLTTASQASRSLPVRGSLKYSHNLGYFDLLESWVIQFISTIRKDKARKLLEESRQQRKTEFDLQNFTVRQLL